MDQDLADIQSIQSGDARGYQSLLKRHRARVFTVAKRVVGDHQLAEEVAQDAFVKAFKSLGEFRGDARFSTWLYRITCTTAISCLRKEKKHRGHADMDDLTDVGDYSAAFPDGYKTVAMSEQKTMIQSALARLKPEQSLALTLFYLQERSLAEIADVTGEEMNTVKVRVFRARQHLGAILQKDLHKEWETWR